LELPKCINAQVACKERQQQAEIVFIGEAAGRHSHADWQQQSLALINEFSEEQQQQQHYIYCWQTVMQLL
jgi:hypothetical protein